MPAAYDAAAALERIEHELIDSMMRNLRRHLDEETDMGFDWEQWQVLQLKHLETYRKKNLKKYGPQFRQINLRIKHAIQHARVNGQKEEEKQILKMLAEHPELKDVIRPTGNLDIQGGSFFKINEQKLDALVKATENDLTKAEHAVLRRCNDQYRKIIFDAQMYANTGAGTVEKAIDMATHDFIARGIDSIVYKNGSRHTISDYADMAIRTANRRATLMGAGEMRKKYGRTLVIVNRRGTMTGGNFGHACPQCIPWLGKILIDDVYSGGRPDGKHQLVSTAMQQGFLHPRCKDSFHTYYPGITSVPDPVTKKELEAGIAADRQEAERQYAERQAEKYERLAETRLDPENLQREKARKDHWEIEAEKYHAKANMSNDPVIRMVYDCREKQMRETANNSMLKKSLGHLRYKDGAPVKRFADITNSWFKEAVPKSHPVVKLNEYVKDGTKYVVDNYRVVMKPSQNELRIANLLREKIGGEIYIVPKVNIPDSIRTPDFLFNGTGYDLKTITGSGNSTLRDAVKRKKGQSRRFIFDLSNSKLTISDVEKQMHGMFSDYHTAFVEEIVIVRGDNIEKVYRRA